ncbi:MAG TPA: extracellular solute-binding protein [Clostridiales bacterium]|nr:extracellular solute-binding protein [Clostridiales bacterium]
MKKSILLMLALVLVLMSLAGCAGDNPSVKPTDKPSQTNEPAPSGGSDLETYSFTAMVNGRGVDDSTTVAHQAWLAKMEDLMGMKLDIKFNYVPNAEYDDKMKILLSGGDLPDYFLLPFLYNYTEMANEGYFLDFAKYDMPNYMKFVDMAKDGRQTITMDNGMMPAIYQVILPITDPDKAPDLSTNAMFNYTAFQREGIEIPNTLDEWYIAAKKFKEKYPNSYPINTNYVGIFPVFHAYHVYAHQDGAGTLYWDGDEFTFAGLQDGYKLGVEYLRKLYAEGLFDPEYIIETVDTVKTKMLNENNFMLLNAWRTHASEYTRDSGDKVFVSALTPEAEGYGKPWQTFSRANQVELLSWTIHCVNAETERPDLLTKIIDLQFIPEVYEITSWGVEGVTYNIVNGEKKFIDEFYETDDPSKVADKYGLWNDRSGRANPGLRLIQDNKARHVSFPIPDYTYFGGKYEEVPVLDTEFFRNLGWPNDYIPPHYNTPAIKLTAEENEEVSAILTQLVTYTSQMQADFISGDEPMENWDAFMDTFKNSYNIQRVLDIYNAAAKRYFEKNQ